MPADYECPNCGATTATSKGLVRHLLEEAGEMGVTTAAFLRAGCGSRFGARICELRHQDGMEISEQRVSRGSSLYVSADVSPGPVSTPSASYPADGPGSLSPPPLDTGPDETPDALFDAPTLSPASAVLGDPR